MTETTEAVKLSIEELNAIDIAEFDEEQAAALHTDDLLYLLKRKLDETPARESLQLLGAMMDHTSEKLNTLAPLLQLSETIPVDPTAMATAISGTVETLEELVKFIQVVIDRFGVKE